MCITIERISMIGTENLSFLFHFRAGKVSLNSYSSTCHKIESSKWEEKLKMILRKSLGFQYVNALSCVWVLYVFLGCLKIEHFVFFLFNAFGRLPFACGCCCWLCRSGHSTCKSSACISHVFAVFVNIRNSNYCCGGDVETAERARNTQQQ